MYNLHLVLTLLAQILLTSSLAISITSPDTLVQPQPLTPNTTLPLRQPGRHNLTDSYYIECERVSNPGTPGLNPSHCLYASTTICHKLTQTRPSQLGRNRWQWEALPGCALGFYLPRGAGPDTIPSMEECETDIYVSMIERCAFSSQFNVGSINVERLPERPHPGLPMTEGYPRYVMAPERL